jgi:hypothetical protein
VLALSAWLFVAGAVVVFLKRKSALEPLKASVIFRVLSFGMLGLGALNALLLGFLTETNSLVFIFVHGLLASFFWYVSRRAGAFEEEKEEAYSQKPLREKFAILFVAIFSAVFCVYFAFAWGLSIVQALPIFVSAIVVLIVLAIIGSIGITLTHAPVDELDDEVNAYDERDQRVAVLSYRNAYFLVAPALVLVLVLLSFGFSLSLVINIGLAALVISEIVKYGSQVYFYQFGDH